MLKRKLDRLEKSGARVLLNSEVESIAGEGTHLSFTVSFGEPPASREAYLE